MEARVRPKAQLDSLAISLALQGKWQEAARINQEIVEHYPDDVEALNRLGKALMELGDYQRARGVFNKALALSPYNTIAKKNIERLASLEKASPAPVRNKTATPRLFIEESGKSVTTYLQRPADERVLARLAAGDEVVLVVKGYKVVVEELRGEYIGQLEPKLASRLMKLMEGGNHYSAAVTSVNGQHVKVIVRETYKHPNLADVVSFPSSRREELPLAVYEGLVADSTHSDKGLADIEDEESLEGDWREKVPFAHAVDMQGSEEEEEGGEEETEGEEGEDEEE